jgi:hypothetical protein
VKGFGCRPVVFLQSGAVAPNRSFLGALDAAPGGS